MGVKARSTNRQAPSTRRSESKYRPITATRLRPDRPPADRRSRTRATVPASSPSPSVSMLPTTCRRPGRVIPIPSANWASAARPLIGSAPRFSAPSETKREAKASPSPSFDREIVRGAQLPDLDHVCRSECHLKPFSRRLPSDNDDATQTRSTKARRWEAGGWLRPFKTAPAGSGRVPAAIAAATRVSRRNGSPKGDHHLVTGAGEDGAPKADPARRAGYYYHQPSRHAPSRRRRRSPLGVAMRLGPGSSSPGLNSPCLGVGRSQDHRGLRAQ